MIPDGPTYAVCSVGGSECDSCVPGPDPMAENGQCSKSCGDDDECPTVGAKTARCVGGVCIAECLSNGDCEAPLGCYHAPLGMMDEVIGCFDVVDPVLSGTESCLPGPSTTCKLPATCVFNPDYDSAGLCSMRCNPGGSCPDGGLCLEVFNTGAMHCFKPCTVPGDCHGNLTCTTFENGGDSVCIPPGWMNDGPLMPPPM